VGHMGNAMIDSTHDFNLRSWVPGADGHREFPIQNLPLCSFSTEVRARRGGVGIGDFIVDMDVLSDSGLVAGGDREIVQIASRPTLNAFFALPKAQRVRFRQIVSRLLAADNRDGSSKIDELFVPIEQAVFHLPADVGDYTDFFAGIHHALNAGRMFRPDNPLLPNYKHVPIAYHGRSSSVRVSGHPVVRPPGQFMPHGASTPEFGPSRRLDFELEAAIWISGGNALGRPINIENAGDHIVGFGLLNDWSARDIQAWETQPLGPFLGKNFMTTVSPFVVTAEALAPFRRPQARRPDGDPSPMAYLLDAGDQATGAFDIHLEVHILSKAMRDRGAAPHRLSRASALDLYWTPAQMIAHHTSNGCDLQSGDLFGTGTISSPNSDGHGSLVEMTLGGRQPVTLVNGETRTFLEDGDEIIFSGWCEGDGYARIGFGEARAMVMAASQI
jgi:fumarylacetoacetase